MSDFCLSAGLIDLGAAFNSNFYFAMVTILTDFGLLSKLSAPLLEPLFSWNVMRRPNFFVYFLSDDFESLGSGSADLDLIDLFEDYFEDEESDNEFLFEFDCEFDGDFDLDWRYDYDWELALSETALLLFFFKFILNLLFLTLGSSLS